VENRWQQTPQLPISDEAEKTCTLMVKANGIKAALVRGTQQYLAVAQEIFAAKTILSTFPQLYDTIVYWQFSI
jgi:hypothetical protein